VSEPNTPAPAQAGFLLRLFWMLLGHAIVFMSLGTIIVEELAFPSILDGVIWITVALMIVARRVDITRWNGTTSTGEPATLVHWRSYTVTVICIAAAGSALVHVLGR
jgi:hypothetical protein